MAMMSWQYIAGFFDGEGSCSASASCSGRRLVAYLAQSGPRGLLLLKEIQEFLRGRGIKCSVFPTNKTGSHKCTLQAYRLSVSGFGCVPRFMKMVLPYLRIKRTEVQDILRYDTMFPNLFKSPLTAAWRSEKQSKGMPRGAAWHARYDGKTGRRKKAA